MWEKAVTRLDGLEYFQSHGEEDPLLSYAAAEDLNKMLETAGLKGEFHGFRGGHEIPRQVLQQLGHFINYRVH